MPKYLYIFSFQTPDQIEKSRQTGFAEEASQAMYIEAASPEEALAWGREVSEEFVRQICDNPTTSWRNMNFAHWIEKDPEQEYPKHILAALPVIAAGQFPDFALLTQ